MKNKMTLSGYIIKVFTWMFLGLLVTGITSYVVSNSTSMLETIFANPASIYILLGLELLCVFVISRFKEKLSFNFLLIVFVLYSIINGLTFSVIFLIYELTSIVLIFGLTALLFGGLVFYGYVTKKDMTKIGNICIVALIVIIIATIVNLFLKNEIFDIILTIIGILIFVGLTVYDMQKIKNFYTSYENDEEMVNKVAIYGALELYLDFINLFIRLLRLLGKRKN